MNEPLRGKVDKSWIDGENYKELFWKDDVKSAVEFYKKYHNHRDKFNKDYPDKWNIKIEFNWWLFNYCFGDVTE